MERVGELSKIFSSTLTLNMNKPYTFFGRVKLLLLVLIVIQIFFFITRYYNTSGETEPKTEEFQRHVLQEQSSEENQSEEETSFSHSVDTSPPSQPVRHKVSAKLWFMPTEFSWEFGNRSSLPLLFGEDPSSDRVIEQLMYLPPNYDPAKREEDYKKIFITPGSDRFWKLSSGERIRGTGSTVFQDCPVKTCTLVDDDRAEFVLTRYQGFEKRHSHQLVIVFIQESPVHPEFKFAGHSFDLTSTYRTGSDVRVPYARFVYFNDSLRQQDPDRNYATNKTKNVAWFVSNCGSKNDRLGVGKALGKYIDVDIYGRCGDKKCPKKKGSSVSSDQCYDLLRRDYRFYLAFENSNCRDYITEKLFHNALKNDIVPVVMGASREDYEKVAPEGSFIHIDDFETIESLAQYLHRVSQNDTLYNEFFRWKGLGELTRVNIADYWCRLCATLHSPNIHNKTLSSLYNKDFATWWAGPSECWKTKIKY